MVLANAREELGKALADLVAGRLSNEAFLEVHTSLARSAKADRAVVEVGEFGEGFCVDDLVSWPYYLVGPKALSEEDRETAERCRQFLRCDREYGWPPTPWLGWLELVRLVVVASAVTVALFTLALLPVAMSNAAGPAAAVLATVALLATLFGIWVNFQLNRFRDGRVERYWANGERRAWPFLTVSEYRRGRTGQD